jgi:hypothetical protein
MKVAKISHIARAKAANDIAEMKASNAESFEVELDRPSEYLSSNPKQIQKNMTLRKLCVVWRRSRPALREPSRHGL